MDTKQRIIESALLAFNDRGYHSITIADIAQLCGMSRGNLAYHYKYKEHILNDIVRAMVEEVKRMQRARKDYPAFSNLSLDVNTCGVLQDRYPFIFRDMSVLGHGAVKRVMNIWSETSIKRNMEAFAFAIELGNMREEPYPGLYYQLAVNAWMVTFYWVSQKSVRSVKRNEQAEKMVWSTIVPHFTEKGIYAFNKHYGHTYLSRLGKPFDIKINLQQVF